MGAMTSTPPSVLTPERQGERIVGGRLCVLERGEDAERMQRGCREVPKATCVWAIFSLLLN